MNKLKTWHFLFLLPVLGLVLLLYLTLGRTLTNPDRDALNRMTAFVGDKFEASGVTAVPGTNGVLFVDNGRKGQVFWMELDQNGKQSGAIKAIQLGAAIEDIEGITSDGNHFYVVSSQSRPKAIASVGLVRFKFDARSQSVEGVEPISGLKGFLVGNTDELREEGERKGKDGGVNIEGLAWDPRRGRLLLGMRSPIIDGRALVVPLRLRDPKGAFSVDNLEVENSKAIRVSLGGVGIRGFEYDGRTNAFKIITGAAEDQDQTDFGLWEWKGDSESVPRQLSTFDKSLKPEGVARATAGKRDFTIVVFDAGGYTTLD